MCKAESTSQSLELLPIVGRGCGEGLGSALGAKASDKGLQDAPRKPLCLGLSMSDCPLPRSPCLISSAELNFTCNRAFGLQVCLAAAYRRPGSTHGGSASKGRRSRGKT